MRVEYNETMTEARGPHARLVERLQEAAEAESVSTRALQWRDRTDEDRWRALVGLMRMSVSIAQSRPHPYVKPALAFPRFSSVRHARR